LTLQKSENISPTGNSIRYLKRKYSQPLPPFLYASQDKKKSELNPF
jgi:hypothetical protein